MSRGDSRHERTAEEREHDRLERERRRARRRGEPPPEPPLEFEPASVAEAAPAPVIEPPPEPPLEFEPGSVAEAAPAPVIEPPPEPPLEFEPGSVAGAAPAPVIEPVPDPVGADELFAPPAQPAVRESRSRSPTLTSSEAPPESFERSVPEREIDAGVSARGIGALPRRALRARRSGQPPEEGGFAGEHQRPHSPRGRVFALVALALVLAALWFLFSLFQPLKGAAGGAVIVEIPRGTSVSGIGDLLARDGVVSSGFFFNLRATIGGDRGSLKSGRFKLARSMSYGAALSALTSQRPMPLTTRVTVPEGASRVEEAARVKLDGLTGSYLNASVHSHVLSPQTYGAPRSTRSLEGFLFPATYELLPGAKVSQLVNEQLAAFKLNDAKVNFSVARSRHLTPYQVLTVASMVEREAQLARERPLIAAVIYNRLRARMPIGIDATIRFALGNYTRPLTTADLKINSPYNTRRRQGLPPTPIGSPGLASIEAAARPAKVGYLYYVVKPNACGEHVFSSNYAQFLKDAARYASARAAKGGRSPTKC
ncbi:MAG: endolytic transglycosylase MltG [Solirubrobacteraceae bacterium]